MRVCKWNGRCHRVAQVQCRRRHSGHKIVLFVVCFFATVINMYSISHILHTYSSHIFYYLYIHFMYIVYSLLYLMNRDIDHVCLSPQHPVKFAT